MVRRAVFATLAVVGVMSLTALADPKDDLTAAINKTAEAPNYSWTSTVEGGFGAGKTTGKTEKDGYTQVTLPMRDQTMDVFIKGKKAAIKTDDGWKTADELTSDQGGGGFNPARFAAMMAQNYKTPLEQAQDVSQKLDDVKAEADGFSGTLSEAAAKEMLTFRGRGNRQPPEVKNPKATIRVWTKDGAVTKAEYHVTGTVNFRGEDRDVDRTTTIEFTDVGSTKVEAPDEVKKLLESSGSATTAPQ